MNTVGFGDITPNNNYETLFVIFFIFVGCGLFAMNISQIGMILSNISKRSKECKREMNIINHFMLDKNITFELKIKVRKYLQYIWNEEKIEELEEQWKIINKLSDSLKDELLLEANGPFIRDIKLFNLNFSEEILQKTVNIMIERRYTPGDLIFSKVDSENTSLFIIRKGQIELFYQNLSTVKKLGPGDLFGEMAFFSGKKREFYARSLDFTNVFEIKKSDFLEILQKSKSDLERYCQMKDSINLYDDYEDLYMKCFSCLQASHRVKDCPILHYVPKKEIIILKHICSIDQQRNDWMRSSRNKSNALVLMKKIRRVVKKIKDNSFLTDSVSFDMCTNNNFNESEDDKSLTDDNSCDKDQETMERHDDTSEEERENPMKESVKTKTNVFEENEIASDHWEPPNINARKSYITEKKKKTSFIKTLKNREGLPLAEPENVKAKTLDEKNLKTLKTQTKRTSSLAMPTEKPESILLNHQSNRNLYPNWDFDKLKNYENYFPDHNVEQVLDRLEDFKMRSRAANARRNGHLRRNLFYAANDMFNHEKKRKFSSKEISKQLNSNESVFHKKFFKSVNHIEKMIEEEQFDAERLKKHLREKAQKENDKVFNLKKIVEFFLQKKKSQNNSFGIKRYLTKKKFDEKKRTFSKK